MIIAGTRDEGMMHTAQAVTLLVQCDGIAESVPRT